MVGLYPHIPHDEGVQTMSKYLDLRDDKSVSKESLCTLAEIVLKQNYLELGNNLYHQLSGTAIGTKFAPPYANIFMAGLEKRIFERTLIEFLMWLRFLDDIFCIWTQAEKNLTNFSRFLITFTQPSNSLWKFQKNK